MALDVYVGSLTRYYLGNWENAGARAACEMDVPYLVVRTQPEAEDAVTDPAVVRDAVITWRKSLELGLNQHLPKGLVWSEESEAPYFTDRPTHDGYSSLVLLAAHAECPEFPMPDRVVSAWQSDEAYKAITSPEFKSRFSSLFDVEIWLPCRFSFKFQAPDVTGTTVWFGSSAILYEQLLDLERIFRGELETVPQTAFDQSARFGLEIFLRLARFSVEHQLPMKLDY
jgi:hypothetical protein